MQFIGRTLASARTPLSRRQRLGLLALLVVGTGLLLAGCASKTTQPSQYSGFLSDYSQLQPATSASGAPVLRWVSADYKASN